MDSDILLQNSLHHYILEGHCTRCSKDWTAGWEIVTAADCWRPHAARRRRIAGTSFELQDTDKDTDYCLPRTIAGVVVDEKQAHKTGSVEILAVDMSRQTPVRATNSIQNSIESAHNSVHWTAWTAVGRYFFVAPR